MAFDQKAAIDRAGKAARHAVARHGDVGPVGKHRPRALVGQERTERSSHDAFHHHAPARRAVDSGHPFDELHRLDVRHLGTTQDFGRQQRIKALAAELGDDPIGEVVKPLGFIGLCFNQWQYVVGRASQVLERRALAADAAFHGVLLNAGPLSQGLSPRR